MDNTKDQNKEPFTVTGNWEKQSTDLKTRFSQLTDEDLKYEQGKENELLTRVQSRLKKGREEVIGILHESKTE